MCKLLTDPPVRYPCGLLWAADYVAARPELQAITARWQAIDGATARCDRALAEASLASLFERAGLHHPAIRWWDSPAAMLVAHDIRVTLPTFAASLHSNELADWLRAVAPFASEPGSMVDAQALCTAFRDSPTSQTMGDAHTRWHDAPVLAMWADRLPDIHTIERGIRAALGRPPRNRMARRYSERSNAELWPGELAFDLLRGQFAMALGDPSIDANALHAAVDLVCNVHLALLREDECWLCDRPIATDYGVIEDDGAIGCTGVHYADGTTFAINTAPSMRM